LMSAMDEFLRRKPPISDQESGAAVAGHAVSSHSAEEIQRLSDREVFSMQVSGQFSGLAKELAAARIRATRGQVSQTPIVQLPESAPVAPAPPRELLSVEYCDEELSRADTIIAALSEEEVKGAEELLGVLFRMVTTLIVLSPNDDYLAKARMRAKLLRDLARRFRHPLNWVKERKLVEDINAERAAERLMSAMDEFLRRKPPISDQESGAAVAGHAESERVADVKEETRRVETGVNTVASSIPTSVEVVDPVVVGAVSVVSGNLAVELKNSSAVEASVRLLPEPDPCEALLIQPRGDIFSAGAEKVEEPVSHRLVEVIKKLPPEPCPSESLLDPAIVNNADVAAEKASESAGPQCLVVIPNGHRKESETFTMRLDDARRVLARAQRHNASRVMACLDPLPLPVIKKLRAPLIQYSDPLAVREEVLIFSIDEFSLYTTWYQRLFDRLKSALPFTHTGRVHIINDLRRDRMPEVEVVWQSSPTAWSFGVSPGGAAFSVRSGEAYKYAIAAGFRSCTMSAIFTKLYQFLTDVSDPNSRITKLNYRSVVGKDADGKRAIRISFVEAAQKEMFEAPMSSVLYSLDPKTFYNTLCYFVQQKFIAGMQTASSLPVDCGVVFEGSGPCLAAANTWAHSGLEQLLVTS